MQLQFKLACTLAMVTGSLAMGQFTLQGPGVDPADFRVTTFASDLQFPVGMAPLDDGSLLVATTNGSFFSSSRGSITRLVDNDGDGQSDESQVLVNDVPSGALSSLRVANDLVFTIGQGRPISIYRMGADFSSPLSLVGSLALDYPRGGWLHPSSALQTRVVDENTVELYFALGSRQNFTDTTDTVSFESSIGPNGQLAGDAIHRVTITDDGTAITSSGMTQIATGLRSASGMAFHPTTGDLYFEDNGIDGLSNANEPHSADELNLIPAADIGGDIEDFGFPDTYTAYRTDVVVGNTGIQPLAAFQPIDGAEAEGPNDIAFAPAGFPDGLNNGVFVGMHGRFSQGGIQNEENALVFVDLEDNSYFHFIGNDEADVGHLDGLVTFGDSLFVADISPNGGFGSRDRGIIYQIKSLVSQVSGDFDGNGSYECADIDVLVEAIAAGANDLAFDLTGDGAVTLDDRDAWLVAAGEAELGSAFLLGDINLGSDVSSSDLGLLLNNFGATESVSYCGGDLNADSSVSSTDLGLLLNNFGSQSLGESIVPEPRTLWLLALTGVVQLLRRRRSVRWTTVG